MDLHKAQWTNVYFSLPVVVVFILECCEDLTANLQTRWAGSWWSWKKGSRQNRQSGRKEGAVMLCGAAKLSVHLKPDSCSLIAE